MLKVQQPGHQSGQGGRATGVGRKEPEPIPLEHILVDLGGQFHQLVAHVDHFDQSSRRRSSCSGGAFLGFISRLEIAGFLPVQYPTPHLRPNEIDL